MKFRYVHIHICRITSVLQVVDKSYHQIGLVAHSNDEMNDSDIF